jgi:16S rRNA (guanine966-N2)-methyltransferase
MRVVAGEYKGRRLRSPRGFATRPTSARTREAVFSILGDIEGAAVLDLFAGSGALGIEALSRGAAHVVFVDDDAAAITAIARNVEDIGVEPLRYLVAKADVRNAIPAREYDLVLIDPPYAQAASLSPILARELPPLLRAGARVVSESDQRAPLTLSLPVVLERRYGDTLIRIHSADET